MQNPLHLLLFALVAIPCMTSSAGADYTGPETCASSSLPLPIELAAGMSRKFCTQAEAESPEIQTGILENAAAVTVSALACPGCPGYAVGCARSVHSSFVNPHVLTYSGPPTTECPGGTFWVVVTWDSGDAWIECGLCSFPNPS